VHQEAPNLPANPVVAPPPPPRLAIPKAAEEQTSPSAPRPEPAAAQPVILEPKPVFHPAPPTPALALQRGISGAVRLEATVGTNGTVTQIKVVSGDALLAAAAKAAVFRWRYEPGTLNGRVVPMNVQIRVVFAGRQ
jgi:protein TonB